MGLGNGLSPAQRQAIICTNDEFLSMGLLGVTFSEIWIKIYLQGNELENVSNNDRNFVPAKMHYGSSLESLDYYCDTTYITTTKMNWQMNLWIPVCL